MAYDIQNKGKDATLKITGIIGWWETSGEVFSEKIDALIDSGVVNVSMYINSPGGSMIDANEIGNQISRFEGKKSCHLGAIVASAATVLSTYFDTVSCSVNTQYMIHDPSIILRVQHEVDYDSGKAVYVNLRNDAIARYVSKTGLKQNEIDDMMLKTTWMNAHQAKKNGFVDGIKKGNAKVNGQHIQNLIDCGVDIPESLKDIKTNSILKTIWIII